MGKEDNVEVKEHALSAAFNPDDIITNSKYINPKPDAMSSLSNLREILKSPQEFENIKKLYSYCDYYISYDSVCGGAIKNIFIPFSQTVYRLVGGKKKSRTFFENFIERNNIDDIIRGCANDYHKYGNCYVYFDDNGTLSVLPPHRCFVESISVDGEPIISFEIDKAREQGKTDTTSIERKYSGYPKVIQQGVKKGEQYVQLPVGRAFSVSYSKASWEKYALPPLTPALSWLVLKETLNKTLDVELKNMRSTFLHVNVGDKDFNKIPSIPELNAIGAVFYNTLKRDDNRFVVTSWNVESEFKKGGSKESLETINDMMSNINWNILSALSISASLATGDNLPNTSSSSNFSTIQAAVTLINKRINSFLMDVQKMINKIFRIISLDEGFKDYPTIEFDIVDLKEDDTLTEQLLNLYDKGFLSKETVFSHTKFSFDEELEKRKQENDENINEIFTPPAQPYNLSRNHNQGGRPRLDYDDRTTDVDGKNENPRPSTE